MHASKAFLRSSWDSGVNTAATVESKSVIPGVGLLDRREHGKGKRFHRKSRIE